MPVEDQCHCCSRVLVRARLRQGRGLRSQVVAAHPFPISRDRKRGNRSYLWLDLLEDLKPLARNLKPRIYAYPGYTPFGSSEV